jgi:hypothetical protein
MLPRRLELRKAARVFELEIDADKRWNILQVITPVTHPKRFSWGLEPVPEPRASNAAPYRFHGKFDEELFDSVVADIQALESSMSLFYPIKRIDWRHPVLNVEFEPGDWRDPRWGDMGEFRMNPKTRPSVTADEESFAQIAFRGLASHHLTTIESFWREGENEMFAGRFINAFYNFYFVLEGLYGNRKWRNDDLEGEFNGSAELKAALDSHMAAKQPRQHIEQIYRMLPEQKKKTLPTHGTLFKLIIDTRNRLHHFSNDPKKPHGSPLVHDEYEGIAIVVRSLAHQGLVKRAMGVTGVSCGPVQP